MSLLSLFPTLLPGETIHSAASRYHMLSGHVSEMTSLVQLFGNRARSIASDFPSGLGNLMTWSANAHLTDDHTLLPLFSPFLGEARSETIRSHMLSRAERSLKMAVGVMNAGFERYRARRYCPSCMLDDSTKYGVAYWHVVHQAAGVLACPVHRVPLYYLSVYGEVLGPTHLMLPRCSEIQESASQYCFTPAQLIQAHNVATLLHWGLLHPVQVAQLLSEGFLNYVLLSKGLVYRNRLKAKELEHNVEDALQYLPPDDEFKRLGAQCQCCPPWVLGLIRRQDQPHHPLFYFALLGLMDISVSQLDEFLLDHQAAVEESSARVSASTQPVIDEGEKDRRRAKFSAESQKVGFRKTDGYSWLYRNDRQWLQTFIRSHPHAHHRQEKVKWEARDEAFAQEIYLAKTDLLSRAGKPVQITRRSLARHLCIPGSAWRRLDLLPLTASALRYSEETARDFQARRVAWAFKEAVDMGTFYSRASILRRAGIRVLLLSETELDSMLRMGADGDQNSSSTSHER